MDETSKYGPTKKQHPIERASIITKLFFCWLLPFFVKGYKKDLDEDDIYKNRKSDESSKLGNKMALAWDYQLKNKKTEPSLTSALFSVFKWDILWTGVLFLIGELVKVARPLMISQLLSYYEPGNMTQSKNELYMYAGIIILMITINMILGHQFQLTAMATGMKIRIAMCSLIYRKSLRLSKSALAETTIGQMVNLLSNDVSRFNNTAQHVHNLWLAPIETLIVMYLVYDYVGVTGLAGAFFLILFIPFQMYMGKLASIFRLRTALRTDERVRLMNEVITGIQVIKMYSWEKPFAKLVEFTRRKEIQEIRKRSYIRAINISFGLILNRIAIFLCIIAFVLTGNIINATYAYTVTSFYNVIRQVVIVNFPTAVTEFAESLTSVKRVRHFLLHDEVIKNEKHSRQLVTWTNGFNNNKKHLKSLIKLKNASLKWVNTTSDNTLQNIDFQAEPRQLIAIVGSVGAGKTTLLHAILKELPLQSGSISIEGDISYASQEPWLFGGSVMQNILFGQEYDQQKFHEVVRVCALERDFSILAHGARTLVGERGVTLSGGQRARINLARAIYKDADIYLLDDPLSAVDTHVGKQLFDDCICSYLQDKIVVLVTHQLQYLKNADRIYLLEDGKVTTSGTYNEIKNSQSVFARLLIDFEDEEKTAAAIKRRQSNNIENKSAKGNSDKIVTQEKEQQSTGTISRRVYSKLFLAGGSWFRNVLLLIGFMLSQALNSGVDYFITLWSNYEQLNWLKNTSSPNNNTFIETNNFPMRDFFLGNNGLYTYSVLIVLMIFLAVSRSVEFFKFCMRISKKMHNTMFSKIVFSKMSFFNTNPSGRILNRFSKDMGVLDESIPRTLMDTIRIGLEVASISLVIGTLSPWIILATVIMLIIFYFLRQIFIRTSRNLKRIESITRSPVFTHLSASLQGLTTIRAFNAEDILIEEFDHYQDRNSAAYFLFLCANRTFGFWLDFHCVIYIILIITSILFVQDEIFGGNVGLALTQSMALTGMFQFGIRQWSELENQMTSIERIQEYSDLPTEPNNGDVIVDSKWPQYGRLEFKNVYLRYLQDGVFILKNLSFIVEPRQKVGIVGRTGAGKSSIIQALFRLAETEGIIFIDNVDTKSIPLSDLRCHISIIPQEPVLFSGTLRKNLDPFDDYNDEILWNALDEVELKPVVEDLPSGLNVRLAEGGSNFSVGQRQLLCLARAIIKNNKILVLDEATANVDPHTDALIQKTIRRKFINCTVLTVAHRLHTIMDSDKVLVMDDGRGMEFDHPYLLLKSINGLFSKLVEQTGDAMAENLRSIAENSYKNL